MFLGFIKSKNDETSHASYFFIILFYFDLLLLKVYNINNNASVFGCLRERATIYLRNSVQHQFGPVRFGLCYAYDVCSHFLNYILIL